MASLTFDELLAKLTEEAQGADRDEWPAAQLGHMTAGDVMKWVIPEQWGGEPISSAEMTNRYVALAEACLTSTFVLTQRNGACQRLAGSDNESLKERVLPHLARGDAFATVGISHLTTSRQHMRTPVVQIEERDGEFVINGQIPWVTGAAHADYIVTGGTTSDGRQALLCLPTETPGVTVGPHAQLLALTGSYTASVELKNVVLSRNWLIAGPVEQVMKQGSGGGAGSYVTSALAIGVARRCARQLQREAERRADLSATADAFEAEVSTLATDLDRAVHSEAEEVLAHLGAPQIRQRANSLVSRISQALLAVSKGAGFVRGHMAERAVREAMFFWVWSCPQPVVTGLLSELVGPDANSCWDPVADK